MLLADTRDRRCDGEHCDNVYRTSKFKFSFSHVALFTHMEKFRTVVRTDYDDVAELAAHTYSGMLWAPAARTPFLKQMPLEPS